MADFTQPIHLPLFITSISRFSCWWDAGEAFGPSGGSNNWPSSNFGVYIPFSIPFNYPVKRIFWANGATTSGTRDVGIYSADSGTKLYSTGSTAASGTNVLQYVTVSPDLILTPGRYYFGFSNSATTGQFWGFSPGLQLLRIIGLLQQTSVLPLPTTMTPISVTSLAYPIVGITRTASGF